MKCFLCYAESLMHWCIIQKCHIRAENILYSERKLGMKPSLIQMQHSIS